MMSDTASLAKCVEETIGGIVTKWLGEKDFPMFCLKAVIKGTEGKDKDRMKSWINAPGQESWDMDRRQLYFYVRDATKPTRLQSKMIC